MSSEAKRSYEQVLHDAQRFRRLIDEGYDLLVTVDASHTLTYVSRSAETIIGYVPEEVVGRHALAFVAPDDLERTIQTLERILASPGVRIRERVRLQHRDGTTRELSGSATNLLDDPIVQAIVIAVRDVTEAEEREAALQRSERRLRLLADRARDVIARYRVLPVPQLEYVSPAIERITGYPPQVFYDAPHMHLQLIHPDDRDRLATLMQRTPEEMSVPITLRFVRKDGETVWLEQSMVPELDEHGNLVAIEAVSRDVTEQLRLENDLRRAQKLDAVGRLAGGIAHDFNNLLGVTLLCGEQLKRAVGDDATQAQWADMIVQSARRGAELAQQLLAFARRESTSDAPSDAHLVVRSLQPMLERLLPEDVRLHLELTAREATVALGQSKLEQVLVNLVVNARDAMPAGGTITIRSETRPMATQSSVRGSPVDALPQGIVLLVADQGVGMSEDVVERIFEPFFSTKASGEGSGLGLSVVYGIVTQSGGRIHVRSKPGAGSVFELQWPCVAPASLPPPDLRSQEAPAGGHETLLLVEDAELLRRLEADMLERLGYRVLCAGSAADADRLAAHATTEGQPIHLLLADVVLPDESGVALAERLCARDPRLRVVFTSGHADDQIARHGLGKGHLMLVTKPFTERELARIVRKALDGSDAHDGRDGSDTKP